MSRIPMIAVAALILAGCTNTDSYDKARAARTSDAERTRVGVGRTPYLGDGPPTSAYIPGGSPNQ